LWIYGRRRPSSEDEPTLLVSQLVSSNTLVRPPRQRGSGQRGSGQRGSGQRGSGHGRCSCLLWLYFLLLASKRDSLHGVEVGVCFGLLTYFIPVTNACMRNSSSRIGVIWSSSARRLLIPVTSRRNRRLGKKRLFSLVGALRWTCFMELLQSIECAIIDESLVCALSCCILPASLQSIFKNASLHYINRLIRTMSGPWLRRPGWYPLKSGYYPLTPG
jgi:hypothetical protein